MNAPDALAEARRLIAALLAILDAKLLSYVLLDDERAVVDKARKFLGEGPAGSPR